MKIAKPVRELYAQKCPMYQRLAHSVRDIIKSRSEEKRWFYLDRIKTEESFAQKIESGRVEDPSKLEDFFACTIVVPNLKDIDEAEQFVLHEYELVERRPEKDHETTKASFSFIFDDLRIYVAKKESNSGRDGDLTGLVFEIQIKTILQHAWGVATHDLIYKTDTVSWSTERIAYQVKAMLEHAEIAIADAERLGQGQSVAKKDRKTKEILIIIEEVNSIWRSEKLPKDVKRLAETIRELLVIADVEPRGLREIISVEQKRIGLMPQNISPYAMTLQALMHSRTVKFEERFKHKRNYRRIFIHDDMELPEWTKGADCRIIRC